MSVQVLSTRDIIGRYFLALAQDPGLAWVNAVSNYFESDQLTETYAFLGQSPVFREWIGGRQAKGFLDHSFTIRNKHYESTIEFTERQRARDKTGQVDVRIAEHVRRAMTHWASLVSTLIVDGESALCYDGQYFFDTDHLEGASGSQSNDLSVDISELPAAVHGTTTVPSPEEMNQGILKAITQIQGFLDDQGEPMNEDANEFLVMTPYSLYNAALTGLTTPRGTGLAELAGDAKISLVRNARLNASWTTKYAVFRTDSPIKAFIRQEEVAPRVKARAEGSEFEFENDAHQFGLDAWRNAGNGFWQRACLVTMA